MSSTNKTTYYELPQFVDNDIFNPLVDDNDAYDKIDTALHNIANAEADDASEIVGVKSRLDSAEGDIDALEAQNGNSVLTTTAQTLSGAVNELDADTSALDGRLDIVEDDINNASTGLKAKVSSLDSDVVSLDGRLDIVENDINNESTGLKAKVSAIDAKIGDETLNTIAQTISGAINELSMANIVTPEMYGAKGDGVTDDSNAINLALNTEKMVVFDAKTYVWNNKLTITNKSKLVIFGNGCTIITSSSNVTTSLLKCEHVDFIYINNMNIETIADKADASIYERDAGDMYSNVTFIKADYFNECIIDNIKITNLEGLAKCEDETHELANNLYITNCIGNDCNAFIFVKDTRNVKIQDCIANHKNASRLDHTIYASSNITNGVISGIKCYNCGGPALDLSGVSGYEYAIEHYTISDCIIISTTRGGILVMGGEGTICNCIIDLPYTGNSFPIRNKGSKVTISGCTIKGTYAIYSELSNIDNIEPTTKFIGCEFDTSIIEGFENANNVGGLRAFNNCKFKFDISGSANAIYCDTADASYEITNCYTTRASGYNMNLIHATAPCKAHIGMNYLENRVTLFDGTDTNVVAVNNVCYAIGTNTDGKYAANTVGFDLN